MTDDSGAVAAPVEQPVRPTIPSVVERFAAYKIAPGNGAWGSLHIVLEDDNCSDHNVAFCRGYALQSGDAEGAELADILQRMSKSQRGRLARKVEEWLAARPNR